ncbi:MAG: hypothetical protein JKY50_06615 [Oleispira sp.]|nr:hypothetical protein [Oleispira sp.]
MFIRIYASLLIAVLISAVLSYSFYQWQYRLSFDRYLHGTFNGSLQLLVNGLARHKGENQQRWLAVMERLMGAEIDYQVDSSEPKSVNPVSTLIIQHEGDKIALDFLYDGHRLYSQIDKVSEQHFRMMATLIKNELGRVSFDQYQSYILEHLKPLFQQINLRDISTIKLDGQQLSRLKRFDIVVTDSSDEDHKHLIYSRLAKSDQVLVIGPIAGFNPVPVTTLILMLMITLLVTATSAFWLVYRLEKRVMLIEKGVSDFSRAPAHLTLKDEKTDAISLLASSVNGMSLRIHQLISDQKQMIQAIGHELRTPISRMKFRLEILSNDDLNDSSIKSMKGIHSDIDELSGLLKEALEFDRSGRRWQEQEFSLITLIESIITDLKIEHRQVKLSLYSEKNIPSLIQDKTQIRRLLLNLIQNACKYGDGLVEVRIEQRVGNCLVTVDDNGSGIDDKQKESVFSPFIRLETSRNKLTGGMGLGLAIAKNICSLGGISMTLTDSPLGGARFSLYFPNNVGADFEGISDE